MDHAGVGVDGDTRQRSAPINGPLMVKNGLTDAMKKMSSQGHIALWTNRCETAAYSVPTSGPEPERQHLT